MIVWVAGRGGVLSYSPVMCALLGKKWTMAICLRMLSIQDQRTRCRLSSACQNLPFKSYWTRHRRASGKEVWWWACTQRQALTNFLSSMRSYISFVAGWSLLLPCNISQKTFHSYNCLEAVSQIVTREIFWRPRREPISLKDLKVLSPRKLSQLLVRGILCILWRVKL